MIRVLQIGLGPNPGGMESCIVNYHRFIDKEKVQFDYADIYGRGLAWQDEIEAMGGHVYILPNYKKNPLGMKKQLIHLLDLEKYDIIHINMLSAANMIPVKCACASGSHVIVHSHNTNIPSGFARKVMNGANISKPRQMPVHKWACGQKAGEWMWGNDFDSENILPNAVNVKRFVRSDEKRNEIRKACGVRENEILVGTIGRFSEQKNPLFVPEIIASLRKKGIEAKGLMVGDGDLRESLEEKIRSLGLKKYMALPGLQSDVSPWYMAMDVFILPSFYEGLPIVALEAEASGLPCFISNQVSKEVDLTGVVNFLPISEGADLWADSIIKEITSKNQKGKNDFPLYYRFPEAAECLIKRYEKVLEK